MKKDNLFESGLVTMKRVSYDEYIEMKPLYESMNLLYVYESNGKFYYNINHINNNDNISVLLFKTPYDLVEFLDWECDMSVERYYKLLGYPDSAIKDILDNDINFKFDYRGLEIKCNKESLTNIDRELKLMYEYEGE